jgi:hypothetical protein
MPEAARFQTSGRPHVDDAAVIRASVVNRAWVLARYRYVETRTTIAAIFDESKKWRRTINVCVKCKHAFAHARFVGLEKVNGARAVVTAAAARNAIGTGEIGRSNKRFEWQHHRLSIPW